ncbi:P-loop containing nucleoside triphosphate hydrolase protein [Cadophora sp. MPI-SDFR-AT-0126]|nr:P-loop containing nucleoside triphosphate hydrolase protein [Leotiomycetes sp. MPI-SDFR-AT-0126]
MRDSRADIVLEHVFPLIQEKVNRQSHREGQRPFILGVTGLQGSGKSYLAFALARELCEEYQYNAIEVSLDDFYLPHVEREALRLQNPEIKLLGARGQPGTHDVQLAREFFEQFEKLEGDIWIPSFDKSLFQGDGDRLPRDQWKVVKGPVDVIIFEGWCVGFRPLGKEAVDKKQQEAIRIRDSLDKSQKMLASEYSTSTLADHDLNHLLWVNEQLDQYCRGFMGPQNFDFLAHLDTDDLANVYIWRTQQEHALLERKGSGMTDEQVVKFVQVYMPAYELYLDGLREGFFSGEQDTAKKHLRLVIDINRSPSRAELLSGIADS